MGDLHTERRWEASYASSWTYAAMLVGKTVIKKATITLKAKTLMVLRENGEGESYELDAARVRLGRWANWGSGYAGSIVYLEVDGQALKVGGEALLPDRRYDTNDGAQMDMWLSGPDLLDLVSCLDELGLVTQEIRHESPYRDAPTSQHDEFTLVLRKSPWVGNWKLPVAMVSGSLGITALAAVLSENFEESIVPVVVVGVTVLIGLSLAIILIQRGKARAPARLVIAGRELRLEPRSARAPLAQAQVDDVDVEPVVYSTSGNPRYHFISLRLVFPNREPLTVATDDVRLSWEDPVVGVWAPKYVIGSAEMRALASLCGLSESLSFDRTRWQL